MANITRGISGKGEFSYMLHRVCTMKSLESNGLNHDVDWNQECVMPFLLNIACIEDHHDYSYSPIFLGTLQTKNAQFCDTFHTTQRCLKYHESFVPPWCWSHRRRPGMAVILTRPWFCNAMWQKSSYNVTQDNTVYVLYIYIIFHDIIYNSVVYSLWMIVYVYNGIYISFWIIPYVHCTCIIVHV